MCYLLVTLTYTYIISNGKQPTNQVRDLGVYFDAELNMKAHIRRVAGALLLSYGVYGLCVVCSVKKSQLV